MRDEARAPLFRFDPGWPFTVAGLLLLAAGILIPGHRELLELRGELVRQETREQMAFEQLRAFDEFLAGVRESDPEVIRRLAMAHLNKIPAGEESLLLTPGMNQTVGEWVESSIPDRTVVVPPYPDTVLARWANGPGRLWLLGTAATLLFAGFVLGPSTSGIPALGGMLARRRPAGAAMAIPATADATADLDPVAIESAGGAVDGTAIGDRPEPQTELMPASEDEAEAANGSSVLAGDTIEETDCPVESGETFAMGASSEEEAPVADSTLGFDLVEAKSFSSRPEHEFAPAGDLRADELELWKASETLGDWSTTQWVERMPPEETVPSCDDVTLAFLDSCDGDGAIESRSRRGAD